MLLSALFQHKSLYIPSNDTLLQWNLKNALKGLLSDDKTTLEGLICGDGEVQLDKRLPWIHDAPWELFDFDPDLNLSSVALPAPAESEFQGGLPDEDIEGIEETLLSPQLPGRLPPQEIPRGSLVDRFMRIRGHAQPSSSSQLLRTRITPQTDEPPPKKRLKVTQGQLSIKIKDLSSRLLTIVPPSKSTLSKHVYLANSSFLTQTNLVRQLETEFMVDLIERQLDLVSHFRMCSWTEVWSLNGR
jgi:hypothetical protein